MANQNEKTIVNIPVNLIKETDNNEYIFGIDNGDVARLADEIREHGFTGSIDVIDLHDGTYQVFAGHQRLRAVRSLGWETVPCTVADDMSDAELYRKLLSSNILNRKISPLGYARAIDAYKKEVLSKEKPAGRTRALCAKFFNVAEGQVQRYEAILKTTPYVQDLCRTNTIPYSPLVDATGFSKGQHEELERQIRNFFSRNSGMSLSVNLLSNMISGIKEAETREKTSEKLRAAQETLARTNIEEAPRPIPQMEEPVVEDEYDDDEEFAKPENSFAMPAPEYNPPRFQASPQEAMPARTPSWNEDELERLSSATSLTGQHIPYGSAYEAAATEDEYDDDEEEAVPSWQNQQVPVTHTSDYAVIHAIDQLVAVAERDVDYSAGDEVLAAIKRCESVLRALKKKLL